MSLEVIIAKDNLQVKRIVRLASSASFRRATSQAVIYGERLIQEAIDHQLIDQIFITKARQSHYRTILRNAVAAVTVTVVTPEVMAKMNVLTSEVTSIGLIAIKPPTTGLSFTADSLVLDRIQNPGNLGTILRGACASGIHQVILSPKSVDVYNPKVLQAACGAVFKLNIYHDIDLNDYLSQFQGQVLALTPQATANLYQHNLTAVTSLVLGNEANGLSKEVLSTLHQQVKIPMANTVESLNLAMAATIALFEMARQRQLT